MPKPAETLPTPTSSTVMARPVGVSLSSHTCARRGEMRRSWTPMRSAGRWTTSGAWLTRDALARPSFLGRRAGAQARPYVPAAATGSHRHRHPLEQLAHERRTRDAGVAGLGLERQPVRQRL